MPDKPQHSKKEPRGYVARRYRYTNDYQAVPRLGPNGGRGKQLIYIGPWFLPTNEEAEYKKLVLWMWLLTAAAVAGVLGALLTHPAEKTFRLYLPVLVAGLFPLSFQIMGALTVPGKRSHMDRRQYDKGLGRIGGSAMASFVMICLTALGCLIFWIVTANREFDGKASYSLLHDGGFAALLVLAALAELTVKRLSGRIQVDMLPNDSYHP